MIAPVEPRSAAGSRASSLLATSPACDGPGLFPPRSGLACGLVQRAVRAFPRPVTAQASSKTGIRPWLKRPATLQSPRHAVGPSFWPALDRSSPGGNTTLPCGIQPDGIAGGGIRVLMLTNGIRATCQPGDETPRHLPSAQRLPVDPPTIFPRAAMTGAAPRVETRAQADQRRRAGFGSRTSAGENPRGPAACQPTAGPMTVALDLSVALPMASALPRLAGAGRGFRNAGRCSCPFHRSCA
jgi:hypothetical protein